MISATDMQRVIGLMKASFSHLVLDLSKSYSPIDMIALEMATEILLVLQLDLPCLRNVVRLMSSLDEIGGISDKVRIVVNRVGLDSGQITLKKAQETIGRDIFWQLPNDYRTMVEVRNNGVPLAEQAPKAAITQSIIAMAEAIVGDDNLLVKPADPGRSGLGRYLELHPQPRREVTPGARAPRDLSASVSGCQTEPRP